MTTTLPHIARLALGVVAELHVVRCSMRVLTVLALFALTACETSGYGYVNARSSPVRVVRDDHGMRHTFILLPRHRLSPIIHDGIPDLVTFYDSQGKTLGSVSSPANFRLFGGPIILIGDKGVSYTKLADWPQLPEQERPPFD
jgi:hypothetical protein